GEPGGAADLHGMRISWANAEMLGEHGRQHDVRRDGRIAAEDAVDLATLQAGVGNRKPGGLAHEVQRGGALMPAECRQSDAGDEAHGLAPLPLAGRRRGWGSTAAVPPRHPLPNPSPQGGREKRPRALLTITMSIINTTSAGPAPFRQ